VAVVQFSGNSGCSVCTSQVDLPHRDLLECRAALAKEMDAILKRAHAIAETRQHLAGARYQQLAEEKLQAKAERRKRR